MHEADETDGSLSRQQQDLESQIDLAVQHYNTGQFDQTKNVCHEILLVDNEQPVAWHLLGMIAYQIGRYDIATDLISKAITFNPDYAEAHNSYGLVFVKTGQLDDAVSSYQTAISINPNYDHAHINLGIVLKELGLKEDSLDSYRKAISCNPESINAHYNFGNALVDIGQLDEAAECYKKVLKLDPGDAETLNNLGNVCRELGRLNEAVTYQRKAIAIMPDYAEAHSNLGVTLKELGSLDDAVDHFRQALALNPDAGEVHRHLANNKKFTQYDEDIEAMERAYTLPDTIIESKMHLDFGLGKAFDDIKHYDKAFAHFTTGNARKRKAFEFSIENDQSHFKTLKELFTKELFKKHQSAGVLTNSPVFIIGMPRSGTTLVEQILASHPKVHGAGELEYLSHIITSHFSSIEKPAITQSIQQATSSDFSNAGDNYLEMLKQHTQDVAYITDKMPGNFICIGMIKLMLPNAKIIHCRRDPVDTCLSIYRTLFDGNSHPYAYDLKELALSYDNYSDLMAHWHSTLPDYIHDIHYEDIVTDQEGEVRKLLDHCQLDWDDRCMEFYKIERQVKTASAAQVRRPIYADSIAKWKHYEKHLAPLLDVLIPDHTE